MSDTYDTPTNEDVLQADDERIEAVPVQVIGVPQVDEQPGDWGMLGNILLPTGSTPVKILSANPRRKNVTLWIYYAGSAPANTLIGAMLGRDRAEVSGISGPILFSMNAVTRYEFEGKGELWAKGVNVENSSGVLTAIADSTNDVLINIVSVDWAN